MILTAGGGDKESPDYQSESYLAQIDDVVTVRTVYGGTKTMREARETVLPKYPEEKQEDYDRRVERAVLFNAFKRTVGGLVGMIYRKQPIVPPEMPEPIEQDMANIDMAGRAFHVFARDAGQNAMIDGHTWVHIDHPKGRDPNGPKITRQQERQLFGDQRPYWVEVPKSRAINVQWEVGKDGQPMLSLFAYAFEATERDGNFGEVSRERIRVLRPGSFEVYERADKDQWQQIDEGTTTLSYIPVVFMPSNRVTAQGHFYSEPPLLDLAYENIDHYQVRSDHRYAALWAANPMPYATGVEAEGVIWGPNRFLHISEPNATVGVLETSGEGAKVTRDSLKDIESHMAALGLQMLVRETRAAETAEAKVLDKSESDSALTEVAQAYEDAVNRMLEIHADYRKVEAAKVGFNRDFQSQEIGPEKLRELRESVAAGQLSLETLWEILARGELLPEDFDPDEEREKIDNDFTPLVPDTELIN